MLYLNKLKLISIEPITHIYAAWHHFLLAIFLNSSIRQPIDGLFAKILESDLIPPSGPLHEHTHSLQSSLEQKLIANKKINGTIPTIPEQYLNTTKRELQSLFAATNLCFFPDPKKRPTARRLAFGLGTLYNKLKHKEKFTRKVILDYLVP